MNVSVDNEGGSYELSAAVLIYTNKAKAHAFATKHEVELDGVKTRILPGSPLTVADYANLVKALAPQDQPGMVWRDPRVLASGMGRLVWWEPPQARAMFFKKSGMNPKTFDGRGTVTTPGLVFMAHFEKRRLFVYAIKGKEAPGPQTALFQAPFFNVWSQGLVCNGNALFPGEEQQANPDAWVKGFFGSHFTHPNFTQENRLVRGEEPCSFWRKQLARKGKSFPERVLVELPLKVKDLLEVDYEGRLSMVNRARGEF